MKKRIVMFMMACALTVSGVSGMTMTANAANTEDKDFAFENSQPTGVCAWRDKTNKTKVYVYPKSGPNIYYTVQGSKDPQKSWVNRSNRVAIPMAVKGSITNQVMENKETYARLKFERMVSTTVSTRGVWSPDSTRNYTIFN